MASTGTRLALVLLFLAALLLACWPWLFAPESRPDEAPPAAAANGDAATSTLEVAAGAAVPAEAAATEVERQAAPTAPSVSTGSLLVHVVWGDDKSAAAGVDVTLWRPGVDDLFDELRAPTDALGAVLFEALAPGNVYPQMSRGRESEHAKVAIVAGERAEVTLEVMFGMNCKGRVVDEQGAAVADAEVVFSDWGGGKTATLARSAADGTFALRCIPTHCHIGARKEGWMPSPLRQFTASDGSTVEFTIVLDPNGASLAGVVLDPNGQPVAGAVVRAGDLDQNNRKLPDGASAMGPQCEHVRTDADGRFLFSSVVPGKVPVAARGRGLAPWIGDVEVDAGRRTDLTIRLLAGVTVFGTVRDDKKEPLAKVEIDAGDWPDLGRRSVRTAADGTFRIDGLAAGALKVTASDDARGKVSETLQVVAGEERRWDPVLSAGLQLRGKVIDPDGKPVASVMIEGQLENGTREDHWWGMENTDKDGRFTFNNCVAGRSIRVTARRKMFPEAMLAGVVPGAEELVIQLPKEAWIHIEGKVLGPDDEVLPNVHVSPHMKNSMSGSPAETADAKTGAFRYGPYPPGTFTLLLQADGFPRIQLERAVGPDEVWNVGTLHFQRGGTLTVNVVATVALPKLSLRLYSPDGAWPENLEADGGTWRSGPLPVGLHELQVTGDGIATTTLPVEIRAGAETKLDVPVQPGINATIECVLPADATNARGTSIPLVVRRANGTVAWRGSAWVRSGQASTPTDSRNPTAQLALAPGDYTVEATCGDLRANGALPVAAPGPANTTLALRRP